MPFPTPSRFSFCVGKRARRISVEKREHYPIIEAADSMQTRIATAFLRTVEAVKDQVVLKDLATAITNGDFNGVMQALDLKRRFEAAAKGTGLGVKEISLLEAIKDTWAAGAKAELETLAKVPVEKALNTVGIQMAFDLTNPEALAFLSTYVMDLISEVSDETRFAIGDVVLGAFEQGGHPFEQAREIKNLIGLTQKQMQAVHNFRQMLEAQAFDQALTRELRDKRFDATLLKAIKNKSALSKEQVNRMVARYYERYLKYRAEMIARTETIRASHLGQMEAWRQAVQQGLMSKDRKRMWSLTPDDKLCDSCRSVKRMNPDGVTLDEPFQSDIGPVMGPPLHPHCRCSSVLKVVWRHQQTP